MKGSCLLRLSYRTVAGRPVVADLKQIPGYCGAVDSKMLHFSVSILQSSARVPFLVFGLLTKVVVVYFVLELKVRFLIQRFSKCGPGLEAFPGSLFYDNAKVLSFSLG